MYYSVPKGVNVEKTDDNMTVIRTDKKELVYSDYFGLFFCFYGFGMWLFELIDIGFTDEFMISSLFFFGLVGYLFISLIFSFYEYQIITITHESIEITKKRIMFSTNQIIDRQLIEKIDFRVFKLMPLSMPGVVIMIKWSCNFGNYKIPRIKYKGEDVYFLEHYKRSIREWIVDFLVEINPQK